MDFQSEIVVAGGGIGGLAAALALARQGAQVQLLEQAAVLSEVGAGIQLGPNVTRVLQAWGLGEALQAVACWPHALQSRDARSGRLLGELLLGERAQQRYGAPYACIHRADLHRLLLAAVKAQGVPLHLGQRLAQVQPATDGGPVRLRTESGLALEAALLVGADGLWSRSREALGLSAPPRFSGHLAYRGTVPLAPGGAPARVTVWMGPRLHVVHYPVQAGGALNVVAIVHGPLPASPEGWDHAAQAAALWAALGPVCPALRATLESVPDWRLWPLMDRPPLRSASEMGQGAVALLGDAAHPMRPYLAQGAGMAIEDAQALARCWAQRGPVAARVQAYAEQRWARNARVQARAIRNGAIFHAQGPLAWGRNLALGLGGARVMDLPWLYAGGH